MDIVERLRNPSPPNIQFVMYEWMNEAANEIERLREALREAELKLCSRYFPSKEGE